MRPVAGLVSFAVLVAGLACGSPASAPPGDPVTDAELRWFDYDAKAPLEIVEEPAREEAGVSARDLTYASPKGGRVTATLMMAKEGPARRPGILVMHGLPSNRSGVRNLALDLARGGAVCLAIDAPWARADRMKDEPRSITFTHRDRDEQIQLMVDLRRGIDLLTQRADVDPSRLAYVGISYGAAMGGLLAGIERRIKAYGLIVGDGGLVAHFTGSDDAAGPLRSLPEAQRQAWLEAMTPIEPLRFIGRAAPAALLMQSGRKDPLIPVADAEAWHAAASQPKRVVWYDAGHQLNRKDLGDWLAQQVGIDEKKAFPE